ncbi:MAG: polysaccharide deacetylase family protein [Candidatus Sericytochromatia bacterium]|nr:polysaccharide deacetylase family protein [Candidatus Tanganyikabacteria bacterium]
MPLDRRLLVAGTVALLAIGGIAVAVTRQSEGDAPKGRQADPPRAAVPAQNGAVAAAPAATGGLPPNELGLVPILEYHGIGRTEARWVRTVDNFRLDLAWLEKHGYVTATVLDMLAGFPDMPAGKKPVVLTFDDARGDQFVASGIDAGGLAVPAPASGVGVMMDFSRKHPHFGHRASFYVLPTFFEDDKTAGAKLRFLAANGFEIGNHTWSHLMMKKAPPAKIRDELTRLQAAVREHLGPDGAEFRTRTIALPNGSIPGTPAQQAAAVGGPTEPIHVEALLLVGANPAHSPYSKDFNPLRLARIQAVDDQWRQWFGRKNPKDMAGKETFEPYVSDGNKAAVTFPPRFESRLDKGRLRGAQPRIWTAEPGDVAASPAAASGSPLASASAQDAAAPDASDSVADAAAPEPSASQQDAAAPEASTTAQVAAASGSHLHPGYGEPLPSGGRYQDGRIFHTVQKGQSFDGLFWKYLKFTDSYTGPELRDRIMKVNAFKHPWVTTGQVFEVPDVRKAPPRPVPNGLPPTSDIRGIYCTSTTASFDRIFKLAKALKAVGGNAVVFDVKDGPIAYLSKDSKVREMSQWDNTIRDLPKLVEKLHAMGMHVIARQVLFNDPVLAKRRPDLAIRSKATGKPWLENGKLRWVDPGHPEVQDYNLRLARELAESGVDEIQFDYVRFPAQGNTKDCKYSFDDTKTAKHEIITGFLKRAHDDLRAHKVLLAIDVYGVMAWQKDVDLRVTGQKLDDMAKYVDVICPMVYPSHFYPPFDGYSRPANEPYYFVSQGVERVRRMVGPDGPAIRPWLQAFPYMVSNYNPGYVSRQIQASRDGKGIGWLLWNASNKYDIAFAGVGNWNKIARSTPVVPVRVKGDEARAAKAAKAANAAPAPSRTP